MAATTHINTDSDALASLVALSRLLGPMMLVLPGALDASARRLYEDLGEELPELTPLRAARARVERSDPRTLHVVDTSRADRLGSIAPWTESFETVLCWDTHPLHEDDLPRQELAPAGACVAALVLELERRGITPPPVEAGLFLVGIHEDTGHFTFRDTTELDHRAAALCHAWGADRSWPERYCPRGFTSEQLELLEEMARSARFIEAGGLSVPVLTLELEEYVPELSTLLGQLRAAEGWPAAFLAAALGGRIYVIGRSDGRLDASRVVAPFEGGGRPTAASASVAGLTLPTVVDALALAIRECAGRRVTASDICVRRFVSLPASRTVRDAADVMHRHGVNAIPLTEGGAGGERFSGLVSRREVDGALRHGLGDRPVGEISARPPVWVSPDAPLSELRARLLGGAGRLLLVGDPSRAPLGLVTRTAALLAGTDEPPLAPSRRGPHAELMLQMTRGALGRAWPAVEELGRLAARLEMSAHLVGGCVRDILLERPVIDVDVVVEGNAIELGRLARARMGGRLHVHEPFQTASWTTPDGIAIDLATARTEYYATPASLPRIMHAELRRDLYRRDFTINAMAVTIDPREPGQLHDPYNGFDDLRNGLLRVLHGLSFHDDPTRAYRAARFAARLDMQLAPQTEALLRAALRSGTFETLGLERAGNEIELLLAEPEVELALRHLRDWHLLETVHPALVPDARLFERIGGVRNARFELKGAWRAEGPDSAVPTQTDALWIVLAMEIPADERAALSRLVPGARARRQRWRRGPERVNAAAARLGSARDRAERARALVDLDRPERVVLLGSAREEHVREAVRWWEHEGRSVSSAVSGDRLVELGAAPGPLLGRALAAARDVAWNGGGETAQLAAARRILGLDRASR